MPDSLAAIGNYFQRGHQQQIDYFKRAVFEMHGRNPAFWRISQHFGVCYAQSLSITQTKKKRYERPGRVNFV